MERAILQTEADRYVRVQYLAEGGMGAVYLGKKVGMGGFEKEVVLKQLLPEFTSQPHFIDLFIREAKLAASLDHANIVHTIDLVAAGRDYFIVMEYVRGADLRHITQRLKHTSQLLHPAASILIAREVLAALAYAHKKNSPEGKPLKLIHRDISPSNIMISGAGEVKLTDFGIAKASTHKSVFYRVKGKVGYMSPEQARGAPIDHRSDLYSVAVILHEMLSGERLFVADLLSPPEAIYAQPIPPMGTPDGIDPLLRRGLAVDPDNRFQSAPEFIEALVDLAIANDIAWTSADLALHLAETCGEDPARWGNWQQDDGGTEGRGTEVLDDDDRFSGIELTSVLPPPRGVDGTEEETKRARLSPGRDLGLAELPSEPTRRLDQDEDEPTENRLTREIGYGREAQPIEESPSLEASFEDKATLIAPPHRRTGPRLPLDPSPRRSVDRSGDRSGDRSVDRSGDRSGDRSVDRSGDRSVDRSGDRSGDRSVDRSGDRSVDRAARRRRPRASDSRRGESWRDDAPTID
jgi:serine/threonine protein kinase